MKKNILIISGIAIATLAIAGFLYWKKSQVETEPAPTQSETAAKSVEETTRALEAITETPKVDAVLNPLEDQIPELNPVEKTNPFNVYQNPFE